MTGGNITDCITLKAERVSSYIKSPEKSHKAFSCDSAVGKITACVNRHFPELERCSDKSFAQFENELAKIIREEYEFIKNCIAC